MSTVLGQEIVSRWDAKIEVAGLTPSARAFVIAELLLRTSRRIAVVCRNSDEAIRFHQDVRTFLAIQAKPDLASDFEFFPGWDHSPYRGFNPSIKNRIRRMRALARARSGRLRGLVTDVRALAQRCPPRDSIEARSFSLGVGEIISREDLAAKLEAAGYQRNDPVEDPGTYTARGFIFDIFSPANRKPLRLDFFDDQLETIRLYDPLTQRSDSGSLARAEVLPVTEWTFTAEAVAHAKREIKTFCDHYEVPKKARDAFVERLDTGVRDSALDYLGPYFCPQLDSWLPDVLDDSWKFVICDSLGVESTHDELVRELTEGFEHAVKQGEIVVPWQRLYVKSESFESFLANKVSVQFDDVLLGVPESPEARAEAEEASSLSEVEIFDRGLRAHIISNLDLKPAEGTKVAMQALETKAALWAERGFTRVFVASTASQAERICFLFNQKGIPCRVAESVDWTDPSTIQIVQGQLSAGFRLPRSRLAIVTDSELFGPKKHRASSSRALSQPAPGMGTFVGSLEDLNADELVVHSHHGIGRYRGMVKLELDRVPQDFLLIEYAGADRLYLPVYRLDQVQKYVGAQDGVVLEKLGSAHFERTKAKIKGELQDLAHQLLQLYARRSSREGFSFSAPDETYREFEARFPYAETPDQLRAIDDILHDMQSGKIMDRLMCGDVGYGKTEVAMRAAYRAVLDGKQVAVLVPTTVLAFQHERSFRERFRDAPLVNVGVLSRFKTPKEVKETLTAVKAGQIDIVIGTHRLLSKDVAFKDLGLIIVDEEQRFGVEHKERLKSLRVATDVLTLTATPIPRTLQFSLMGLRDISVINTPPIDRLSVRTYVARFDEDIVRKAITQELGRGGQVFFIHNRVQSINAMADRLKAIIPEAKVIVAHGQMDEGELEKRMLEFYNKSGNVLLCSTIIESGLDIPSANTMIINRADTFGLAQLYQLRGRVGRSQARAYCYLLLPEEGGVSDDAKRRLDVIQRYVELGSGFKIASHDLELRGGGDILGKAQSGHIAAVGFELYTELLDEAIRELRGQPLEDTIDPEIKLPVPALLPEAYVPDVHQRLGLYKRLSQAATPEALHELEVELQDRYGKPTFEVHNLLWLIRIKQLLRQYHIKSLIAGKERVSIEAGDGAKLSPVKTLALVQKEPGTYSLTPDSKVLVRLAFESAQRLFHDIQKLLAQVAEH